MTEFKFFKWLISISISNYKQTIGFRNHRCLNQIMDGNYECEWCNPDDSLSKESS
jgi:hypothetical protein